MNKDFSSLVICSSWLASEFGGHSELRWIEGWSFSKVVRVFSRQVLKGKNEEVLNEYLLLFEWWYQHLLSWAKIS